MQKLLIMLPVLLALSACGAGTNGNPVPGSPDNPGDPVGDTDGDGLSDAEERRLGTNPELADTDGDGLDDGREVRELGFNPEANPLRYNPLVADRPLLGIELVGDPVIGMNYQRTDSSSSSLSNSLGGSSATTVTNSGTISTSIATEVSVSGSIAGPSVSASVSAELTASYTYEQSVENQRTWEQARELSKEESVTQSSGFLRTGVRLTNQGELAFTIRQLVLAASHSGAGASFEPLGNLRPDGDLGELSLEPGQTTAVLTFEKNDLDVDTTLKALLTASNSLTLAPVHELVDRDGTSFAYDAAEARSRTAEIIIDYGAKQPGERYQVATNTDPERPGGTLARMLGEILGIPVVHDDSGLQAVRDITPPGGSDARWVISRTRNTGISSETTVFDPKKAAYDMSTVEALAGDVFLVLYLEDADGDGIGIREEALYGTDPENADTDGDGRSDYEEIRNPCLVQAVHVTDPDRYPANVYSNPLLADADGDNLDDAAECTKGTDPNVADSDGDGIPDDRDASISGADPIIIMNLELRMSGPMTVGVGGLVVVPDGRYPQRIVIDWGDGSQADEIVSAPGASNNRRLDPPITHRYQADGDYQVQVTVTDSEGMSKTQSASLTLYQPRRLEQSFSYELGWRSDKHWRRVADIDGDGDADLIGISDSGAFVALAEGGVFQTPTTWSTEVGFATGSDPQRHPRRLADLDGDGDLDLLIYGADQLYYARNEGDRFAAPSAWIAEFTSAQGYGADYHRLIADLNGDNLPEPLAVGDSAVISTLNNALTISDTIVDGSAAFMASAGWRPSGNPVLATDLDGDRCADLVGIDARGAHLTPGLCNGRFDPYRLVTDAPTPGLGDRAYPRRLADLDGDQRPDLVLFGADGVTVARYDSENGTFGDFIPWIDRFGFNRGWRDDIGLWDEECTAATVKATLHYGVHPRYLADVDGDGLRDVVGFGDAGVYVAYNRRDPDQAGRRLFTGFALHSDAFPVADFTGPRLYSTSSADLCRRYYMPRQVGDVNGDGRADFIGFARDGVVYQLASRLGSFE